MDWLEENNNKIEIILLQQEREQLLRAAISGEREKEDCQKQISLITGRIECLYFQGSKLRLIQ